MNETTLDVSAPAPEAERSAEELARALGLPADSARRLVEAGYTTPEEVRRLSAEELRGLGVPSEAIGPEAPAPDGESEGTRAESASPPDGGKVIARWLDSARRNERPRRKKVAAPAPASSELLRQWVRGDDSALETWMAEEPAPAPPAPGVAPSDAPAETTDAGASGELPRALIEREETVLRWLTGLLDRVKSEQFEPAMMIQEVQDLQRQLYDERTRRQTLEDEVEHVKRGSIAVIKYVRSREAKEREMAIQAKDAEVAELRLKLLSVGGLGAEDAPVAAPGPLPSAEAGTPVTAVPPELVERTQRELEQKLRAEFSDREHAFVDRETELRRRLVQLEGEVRTLRAEAKRAEERDTLVQSGPGTLPEAIAERMRVVTSREQDLGARENELREKFEEIRIASEELERQREPIRFKERELAAWEQQLATRRQALELEARRVEEARRTVESGGSVVSLDEGRKLDDRKAELQRKEEELRNRETLLHQRTEELEKLQLKAAAGEAERMHQDVVEAVSETKVRSGVRRLDDLLFGGFPVGSQILVNGPAHTGKDILARLFVVEGLKLGVPALWVVTDKTYTQIREEMTGLFPSYPEFEKKGMVRYVDLYSRSLGVAPAEPGVRFLSATDKSMTEQLTQAVNVASQELKERYPTYRLVFESVSTVTAYLDTSATFRFLQPFSGRRKLDGASAYYLLETGMHTESDLETLEHMMDGSVNLKIDQLKTFLSVRGITDVQSRAWITYTFSKKAFGLGSFSLDHIR